MRWPITVSLFAALCSGFAGCNDGARQEQPLDSSVAVNLRPPVISERFTLLSCPAKPVSTVDLEGCAEHRIVRLDKAINEIVAVTFAQLRRESGSAASRFAMGERAWLRYRGAVCASRADIYLGGSAAPVVFANCVANKNAAHLRDLRAFKPPSSRTASRVSFLIGVHSLAGLPIAPDTSYRRALRYFARTGEHVSSSFTDGLCRLRVERITVSATSFTLDSNTATPANCTFFSNAVVTSSRWHTANGLRVGAPLASLHRLFPRAKNMGKIDGKHWGIPTGSTWWWLANYASSSHAARPVLEAYVRRGRVAALGITTVGH
jgi:uncharacterized protein YecT (DUF1311 family)